jgi:hypothetical protein
MFFLLFVRFGSAAAGPEDKKVEKYSNLSENYHFVPVGIKTYGAYGPQAIKIGKKIQEATGEKLYTLKLMQRISMAIQKGNAVCVRGCPQKTSPGQFRGPLPFSRSRSSSALIIFM